MTPSDLNLIARLSLLNEIQKETKDFNHLKQRRVVKSLLVTRTPPAHVRAGDQSPAQKNIKPPTPKPSKHVSTAQRRSGASERAVVGDHPGVLLSALL